MVFSLGLGVIYLFNLYSTVPSYFGYLKKISPQALTALPRRAASCTEFQAFSIPAVAPRRTTKPFSPQFTIRNTYETTSPPDYSSVTALQTRKKKKGD